VASSSDRFVVFATAPTRIVVRCGLNQIGNRLPGLRTELEDRAELSTGVCAVLLVRRAARAESGLAPVWPCGA
jgi:hypothetical protein